MENIFENERVIIGEGKMAKVYRYNDFAYKCFHKDYPEDWIAYEVGIQNTINQLGLPTVNYYPSEFPHSIKMDYINGISLADRMRQSKYKYGLEDLFSLLLKVHIKGEIDLPKLNPFLIQGISNLEVNNQFKELAIKYISELPDDNVLCHLDFHFLNLMYAQDQYYIIDWVNAKIGNPIYDFARTYVILYEFAYRISKKYLKLVKEQCGYDTLDLNKAIFVMTLQRLTEYRSEKVLQLLDETAKLL